MRASPRSAIGAFLVTVLVLAAAAAAAGPGDLDPGFDGGLGSLSGRIVTPVSTASDDAADVAIQPDGKVVAGGYASGSVAVARYTSAGKLDTGFGSGGIASAGSAQGRRIALQPDGKIVVAGLEIAGISVRFAVFRFKADGTPDASFDGDGRTITTFGVLGTSEYGWADAVALQPDGKIVVAGTVAGTGGSRVALVRYKPDGSRDLSFGSGGRVTTDAGSYAKGTAVAVQADGKIVVGGEVDRKALVLRYRPDGSLDGSFATSGKFTRDFGASAAGVADLAIQPDGRIVAVGGTSYESTMTSSILVLRLKADGSLDPSFGSGGSVTTNIGLSRGNGAHGVTLQPDGKILVAGRGELAGHATWAVLRYGAGGALDTGFASGGIAQTRFSLFPGTESAAANAVVVQPDGKIVASGGVQIADEDFSYDFALARYLVSGGSGSGLVVIPPFDFSRLGLLQATLACRGEASCSGQVLVGPGSLGKVSVRLRRGEVRRIRMLLNAQGKAYARSHAGGRATLSLLSARGKRLGPATGFLLKGQSALSVTCPSSVAQGGSLGVQGAVRPGVAGGTVVVSFVGPGGKVSLQRVVTDAAGRYKGALAAADAGPWRVRVHWLGTKELYGSEAPGCSAFVLAPPPPPKTATSIKLKCPDGWQQGSPFPISGSLSPAIGGVTITFVYKKPQGDSRTRTATTSSNGGFSDKSVSPDQTGKWRVEASWDGDATHKGSSDSCSIQVA